MNFRMNTDKLRLYLVTDDTLAGGRLFEKVTAAVKGGVSMVQLREKNCTTAEFVSKGLRLKELLTPYGVPLIINDRVDVALAVGADGVHIGQSDMPCKIARKLLGPDKIIGLSVESMEDVRSANLEDADYIGISPVFATPTKTDTAAPFGLAGLARAVEESVHPAVAIGGINLSNAGEIMACGAAGIAVVSAILCSPDPFAAANKLLEITGNDK